MIRVGVPHEDRHRDRGAVLVETALILPLLLGLVLGFIEFSIVEFQQSQASSAARDGARVGIIDYQNADQPGTPANDAVVAAVNARLAGQTGVTVQVQCFNDVGVSVPCQRQSDPTSSLAPRTLEVRVAWPYQDLTFFGDLVPSTITGTSRMFLVGAPIPVTTVTTVPTTTTSSSSTTSSSTSTTLPMACVVSAAPPPMVTGAVVNVASGQLDEPMTISQIVTNGDPTCGTPRLRVYYRANGFVLPAVEVAMAQGPSLNTWSYTWPKNDKPTAGNEPGWAAGQIGFEVLTTSNDVLGQFSFTMAAKGN